MAPNTSWERHPTFSQPDSKVRARLWSVGGGWRQPGCGGVATDTPPVTATSTTNLPEEHSCPRSVLNQTPWVAA